MVNFKEIKEATMTGEQYAVEDLTRAAIRQGADAEQIIQEGFIAAMSIVGEKFGAGEIYIPEMLKGDLDMMTAIRGNLQATIKQCEDGKDFISRDELQEILEEVEEQIDWIETQQFLIDNTGLENYLQSQMGE